MTAGSTGTGSTSRGSGAELTTQAARDWITRWDAQQEGYMPDREERFTALIDVVEATAGRPDPLVLDLGCGPGSLATRLLDRMPAATVVAIDADPLLLALGEAAAAGRPGLRWADLDLRRASWARDLGLDRPADAAVSTTALHWLGVPELRAVYAEVAQVLRPGGVLLNGDHLHEDEEQAPELDRLGRLLAEREERRRFPGGHREDWAAWWDAALADPALAGPSALRAERNYSSEHGSEARLLSTHLAALRDAGFAEAGTLWQRGTNRLLCGVAARHGQERGAAATAA